MASFLRFNFCLLSAIFTFFVISKVIAKDQRKVLFNFFHCTMFNELEKSFTFLMLVGSSCQFTSEAEV